MSLILVISQFKMDHNFTLIVLFPLSFTGFNRLLTTHIVVPPISVIPLDRVPREPGLPEGLIFLRSYHILPYALARRRSAELPVSIKILVTGFLAKLPPHHKGIIMWDSYPSTIFIGEEEGFLELGCWLCTVFLFSPRSEWGQF